MIHAVYPGSFDPVTNGHLDIIQRASKLFDKLTVAVLKNPSKQPLFTFDERIKLIKNSLAGLEEVNVESFSGLLVNYLHRKEATIILKGLRAVSDFEIEFQMALLNRKLDSKIDTIFLMTADKYAFLSSSAIKEIAFLGGSVHNLVPSAVEAALKEKFKEVRK
jgi:pantetheine-phosphate adenylyltransferase